MHIFTVRKVSSISRSRSISISIFIFIFIFIFISYIIELWLRVGNVNYFCVGGLKTHAHAPQKDLYGVLEHILTRLNDNYDIKILET